MSKPADHSIARSISRWLLGGAALLLLVFSFVSSAMIEQQLQTLFDRSLTANAQALAAMVEQELDGVEMDVPDGLMLGYTVHDKPDYFELRDADGRMLTRSPSLDGSTLPGPARSEAQQSFLSVALPDGRAGRMVTSWFRPRLDPPDANDTDKPEGGFPAGYQPPIVALSVATDYQPYLDQVRFTRLSLLAIGLALLCGLTLVLRMSLRIGLSPVDDIRRQIAALDARLLDARVRPNRRCVEMDEIVVQVNALLARVEDSFEHERQFSQDVAHELRTPLSELRTMAEIAQRWPEDSELRKRFFDETLAATLHMERTLGNLLTLARSERGLEMIDPQPFDLHNLTWYVCQLVQARADLRGISLVVHGGRGCTVPHGRDQWSQILRNLLGNAIDYSPSGARVEITMSCNAKRFDWQITNPAGDLQPDDIPHLFSRMWRKDRARASDDHVGLGLALVKAYANQLGLSLTADLSSDRQLCLRLTGAIDFSVSSAAIQASGGIAA